MTAPTTERTHAVKTRLPKGVTNSAPHPLATFLGVFSIGLGLAESLSPGAMKVLRMREVGAKA